MRVLSRAGQSTAEYAVMIGVVVAAIVAMQLYLRRGIQAKEKGIVDHFTSASSNDTGTVQQYEPYYSAESNYTVTQGRTSTDAISAGGGINRTGINETTTRTGTSNTTGVPVTTD